MYVAKWKYALGFLALAGVALFFGYQGLQKYGQYYLEADELVFEKHEGHAMRIMGQVANQSIEWLEHRRKVRFKIQGPSGRQIPVAYDSLTPDNFDHGRDVIIVGKLDQGVIQANQVIVQCPSKYEAAEYDPKKGNYNPETHQVEPVAQTPAKESGETVAALP